MGEYVEKRRAYLTEAMAAVCFTLVNSAWSFARSIVLVLVAAL